MYATASSRTVVAGVLRGPGDDDDDDEPPIGDPDDGDYDDDDDDDDDEDDDEEPLWVASVCRLPGGPGFSLAGRVASR